MVVKWWYTMLDSDKKRQQKHQQKYIRNLWKNIETKQKKPDKFLVLLLAL